MDTPQTTIGRDPELVSIRAFLDGAVGPPSALVIEGEVGIGKTWLWQEAVREAQQRGHRVLVCRPGENEVGLGFAGLIDLVGPWVEETSPALPEPQRRALDVALLRSTSQAPVGQGAVALAVVNLLRTLAGDAPTVVAIDDPQWLDVPTTQALGFALRRLGSAPVAVITTRRDAQPVDLLPARLPVTRIAVPPLSPGATYRLVHSRLGVTLPQPVLARVHEASGGNPFLSLELARAWTDHGTAGVDDLPVPEHLGALLRRRLEDLPGSTRRVLLLAAAMGTPGVPRLERACGHPVEPELALAELAGVVDSGDGTVRFTHPLMAATVYDAASPAQRRMVHRELADAGEEPEERARHLARACAAPDEAVAAALEDASARIALRGASDVAATYAQQALELTPADDHPACYRRATTAGVHALAAGDRTRSRTLFERAVVEAPAGPARAAAQRWLAELSTPLGQGIALCDQALDEAGEDWALASRVHRTRGAICYFLGDVPEAERHAGLGVALAERGGDDEALGMAVAELAHWTYCGGGGIRRDLFDRAITLDGSAAAASPRSHLAKVLMDDDGHDESRAMLTLLLDQTMATGDLDSASTHRFHLAELDLWAGEWGAAVEHARESLQLRQHLHQSEAPLYVEAMARACLGDVEDARTLAAAGLAEARRTEDVVFQMQNLHVLGFVDLSLGDHQSALGPLGEATDLMRPRWHREFGDCHMVPDEIEALVAAGDLARAEDLTSWTEEVARATRRAWTTATSARSRALVLAAGNDLDAANRSLDRALAAHERLPMPLELGRTLLARGVVQRRMRRRAAARTTFEQALALFEGRGATLWAGRARGEIARLGVRSAAQADLTPVEQQMAALVARGYTNREIAASLSLSTKTVEANLSRSYRKLGVRSRAELVARLSGASATAADTDGRGTSPITEGRSTPYRSTHG
ncbi:LuxR family transcriptional regulator [Nocardioides aestuarii]|uniref:ATP-binding protein n=1 Tax=Nocardioides aestuarii TaxID=252231 RepID=A0ABW4TKC4_9ACTN